MIFQALLFGLLGCTSTPEALPDEVPVRAVPAERPPNVLVILWDTARADHMSLYGHSRPTTPRMAKFAEQATVFDEAWSPGTWTVPAHASLFTGLPTSTHGAHGDHRWLDSRYETLAELLSANGYDTVAFSANLYVGSVANLLQGFETVHTTYPRKELRRGRYVQRSLAASQAKVIPGDASTEISPAFRGVTAEKWDKSIYKDAAPVLAHGLIEHLDERGDDRPWFAYLNFMEAHTPRIPSAASREALLTEQERTQALNTDMSLFAENSWMIGQRAYAPEELAAFGNVYDAALRDMDGATGELLDELGRRGVLDDTMVILISDHGESLGEHRMLEHRWAIHEPLLHVPLVIRYPKGGFSARRIEQPVSTIDLFATVLDLAGVPAPQTAGQYSRSLRDLSGREVVFSELVHAYAAQLLPMHKAYPALDLSPWKRTYTAARSGALKLVIPSDGAPELFDLAADPGERVDLSQARPDDRERLEAAVAEWLAERVPAVPVGEQERQLTPEERAQLEILGYIQGDE